MKSPTTVMTLAERVLEVKATRAVSVPRSVAAGVPVPTAIQPIFTREGEPRV